MTELEKRALLERLVRLGATDIPGTPRWIMRHRSPEELAQLQQRVTSGYNKMITAPIMGKAEKVLTRLPAGKVQNVARTMSTWAAQDPVGALATQITPIPFPVYVAGKRLLERGIDRMAPVVQLSKSGSVDVRSAAFYDELRRISEAAPKARGAR